MATEYKATTFYDHSYYCATYRKVYDWIEDWFADRIFRKDHSRIFMSSDNYAFRRRFELTDASRDFEALPSSGLDLPFGTYWPQNSGWRPDERVAAKNAVMIYEGVYEGTTKIKAAPVIQTVPVTLYFGREDDARFAYDTLYMLSYKENYNKTEVRFDQENIDLFMGMTLKDLKFNPTFKETDWLNQNRIYIVSMNLDMRTYAIQTPKQSAWKRGAGNLTTTELDDPGFEKYYITDEVVLGFGNDLDIDFFTGERYNFISSKSSAKEDIENIYVNGNVLERVINGEWEPVKKGSWRYNHLLDCQAKARDGVFSSFPESGDSRTIYVDAAMNPPIKYKWDSKESSYKKVSSGATAVEVYTSRNEALIEVPWTISDISIEPSETTATVSWDMTPEEGAENYSINFMIVDFDGKDFPINLEAYEEGENDRRTYSKVLGRVEGKAGGFYKDDDGALYGFKEDFVSAEEFETFSTTKINYRSEEIPDPSTIENPVKGEYYHFVPETGYSGRYFFYDENGIMHHCDTKTARFILSSEDAVYDIPEMDENGEYHLGNGINTGNKVFISLDESAMYYIRADLITDLTASLKNSISIDGIDYVSICSMEYLEDTERLPSEATFNEKTGVYEGASEFLALYGVDNPLEDKYYLYGRGERILDFHQVTASGTSQYYEAFELPEEPTKDVVYKITDETTGEITWWWGDALNDLSDVIFVKLFEEPKDETAYKMDFVELKPSAYSILKPGSIYNLKLTIAFNKGDTYIEGATKTFVDVVRTTTNEFEIPHREKDDLRDDITPAVAHKDELIGDDRVIHNSRIQEDGGVTSIVGIEW